MEQNNTLATLKQGMTLSTKALSKPNEINIRSEKTVAYYWRRRILRRTHSLTTNNFNKLLCWLSGLTCLQWNHDFLVLNLVRWVLSHHFFCLSNFEKKCIPSPLVLSRLLWVFSGRNNRLAVSTLKHVSIELLRHEMGPDFHSQIWEGCERTTGLEHHGDSGEW